jgi:hypothetical protein
LTAVWTTRSATVGIPNFLSFPDDPLLEPVGELIRGSLVPRLRA